jgi:hypothetical protein
MRNAITSDRRTVLHLLSPPPTAEGGAGIRSHAEERPTAISPKRTYNAGTTIMFSMVELSKPKRMTMAIGA